MKSVGFAALLLAAVFLSPVYSPARAELPGAQKYGKILWGYLETLCGFGPRNPGGEGHRRAREFIKQTGLKYADGVTEQKFVYPLPGGGELPMANVEFLFTGREAGRPILIGTHYDTRPYADEEPDLALHTQPILGANDGGSGAAVLLGLARYLKEHKPRRPVRLVFFDGEDFGPKFSMEMFLGSKHYAGQLLGRDEKEWPFCVVIVDMVGDKELEIFKEINSEKSASWLTDAIFRTAGRLRLPQFRDSVKHAVLDDHTAFLRLDIPSAAVIDFDYPHWHRLSDTLDKCSPESLSAVFSAVAAVLDEI
ncbi:MAG: M28 family peptidase [Nitrospinae bacterium]|nr:M28 family peptidase [Nitrospinota bacterium]